ncbi:DUF4381 domain-containing protein [Shewanella sp. VB17]|uniref:DUF4381 domain-containing protein n=1 Tax=Shewanella sp. VB17 TaxID=2739432 RepID=UPI0015672CEF|nr:DUF4381 domain-containing protein [Shewanella sp. VB17]NRD74590.1 DUF4381 domain-containing protein [Shewanella sp. VB17]
MDDMSQLSKLILPDPVAWWPLAPGCYVILLALLIVLGVFGRIKWQHWQQKRYLREALAELDVILLSNASRLPQIIREVVSVSFNGTDVLSYDRETWQHFLNSVTQLPIFNATDLHLIWQLSYQNPLDWDLTQDSLTELQQKCKVWVQEHRNEY